MNKKIYISLILHCLLIIACNRNINVIEIIPEAMKNHLQRAHLFGNIKTIETETYHYSEKDSAYYFYSKTTQSYSSDGYLTELVILDKNLDTASKRTINYLPNATENYWLEINYKDKKASRDSFIYDRNGYKKEERFYTNDSLIYSIHYQTDGIGSVMEMKRNLPEYSLTNKFYYNQNGLIEKVEEYDPNNSMYKYIIYEYDNYGDEVNRKAYKKGNEMIEYTYTQYNNEGAILKIIFEDRLHSIREEKLFMNHDKKHNWLKEFVLRGSDTLYSRTRKVEYY